jgi:hypothetical protein
MPATQAAALRWVELGARTDYDVDLGNSTELSALKAHRQDPTPFCSGILRSTVKESTRRYGETLAGIRESLRQRRFG